MQSSVSSLYTKAVTDSKTRLLIAACRQLDDEVGVVGLDLCLVGGLVARDCAASVTLVDKDIASPCVRLCLDRAEYAATGVGSVAGVYVHVYRAEAEGAVIARGVAEGQNLPAAIHAGEAAVVLGKSLVTHSLWLHNKYLRVSFINYRANYEKKGVRK